MNRDWDMIGDPGSKGIKPERGDCGLFEKNWIGRPIVCDDQDFGI